MSAIIIAILYNFRFVLWALELLKSSNFSALEEGVKIRFYMGAEQFISCILLFCLIALFNYSWKDRIIPTRLPNAGRILLIILINVFIFYISALGETTLADWYIEGLGMRMTASYFLFANISIAGLAAAEAYFMILIQKIRTSELENIRLKEERTKAELASLKEQISPHFFFNTLNSLSSVIRTEEKNESLDFVENMSQVYRYILDSNSNDTVKISEELEFLDAYSFLLKKRFGDNLEVKIDIDEAVKEHRIPPMALQVLIENTVKHNKLVKAKPIVFSVESREDYLYVQNNVNKKKAEEGYGVGLANLSRRYKMIADREIEIKGNDDRFLVKLPVIKP
ncbi:sensor histidine kinase [candidate division KSB1 bacterium]